MSTPLTGSPVGQIKAAALQGVFEHLSEGLVLADLEGNLVHWNCAAIEMHGLVGAEGQLRPLSDLPTFYQLETLDGQVLPLAQWPLVRTLRGETVRDWPLRLRRLDETFERIFSYGGSLIRDEAGRPQLAVVHITDITARVEAEASLARELERHALLLQCSRRLLDPGPSDGPLIEELFSLVSGYLQADLMYHFRMESPQGPMRLVASGGLTDRQRHESRTIVLGQPFCGLVAVQRQPLIADYGFIQRYEEIQDATRDLNLHAYVCHPLLSAAGELLGTLAFGSTRRDRFADEDIRFFHTLSHMVAVTIDRGETEASLRRSEARLQRQAESLREREAFLSVMFDQLPIVVWSTDRDLRITAMRGAALRDLSLEPERLVGRRVEDISVHDQEVTRRRYHHALAGQKSFYDVERDGRLMRSVLAPLADSDGQVAGTIGMSIDVTDLTQAERAVREAADTMAIAQRVGHFGSWELLFDAQGQPLDHVSWSDELYRIHGFEPETGKVPRSRLSTLVHPDDRGLIADMTRRLDESCPEWSERVRIVRPDGTVRHVRVHARLFFDEHGPRRIKLVGTTQDVTEQQAAEDEIRRLNADLERRVSERTAELGAANAELESFAYAVAHDLRAPLRAMAGFGRALLEDHGDKLEQEAHEYVDEIIGASRTMGELIDAMLSLSRHTRGGLRRESVDLSSLAERVLRSLARAEPEREVTWSVQPDLSARGDHRMIEVVLQNLLSNAWKYTARTPGATLRVEGEGRGSELFVRVSDNGAGFSMAHAAKLFQPFQRLHRQDEFPGIGIGLATVQRIVRRHGGMVKAEGAPGQGAVFEFSLPLASRVSDDQPATHPAGGRQPG